MAVSYVKKCPECAGINLILDKEKGEVHCRDCGLVIEERMVDFGQEWREFDHEQSTSRRRTGGPMTYSVSGIEPIFIRENSEVNIVNIGDFVDGLFKDNKGMREVLDNLEILDISDKEIEAISFDGDGFCFKKISEISRHPTEETYEIVLNNNSKIEVTGEHSLFSFKEGKIAIVLVKELKERDLIMGPKTELLSDLIDNDFEHVTEATLLLKEFNICFVEYRIKSIKKIKSTTSYAYDLTVPGCENFVGGRAIVLFHNTKFDRGLGTDVGKKSDIYQLGGKERNRFFRLRKWQYRISTAIERNLKLALAELKRVSSYLKLPKAVEEESARIYTLAVQRGLVRGRSMESVVAGALYAACRRHEVPRTLDELSEASGIDKKEIGRTYRFVTRELGIRILPSNPVDYLARFASALKLNAETQSRAVDILEKAQNSELTSGRGPTGIAAASLYVAALMNNEKRTQREVADVAGVTEVTIRNRYKELLKKLKLDEKVKKKVGRG